VSLTGPEPLSTNPLRRVAFELRTERRGRGGYPPGENTPSLRRTHRTTTATSRSARLADLPRDAERSGDEASGRGSGQLEIKAIAAAVTERFRVELPDGFRLRIRQTPTLGPADGLPVRVRVARGPRDD
jgi:hypothetical protein